MTVAIPLSRGRFALVAYDAAALARYGEFARPNYPQGVTP